MHCMPNSTGKLKRVPSAAIITKGRWIATDRCNQRPQLPDSRCMCLEHLHRHDPTGPILSARTGERLAHAPAGRPIRTDARGSTHLRPKSEGRMRRPGQGANRAGVLRVRSGPARQRHSQRPPLNAAARASAPVSMASPDAWKRRARGCGRATRSRASAPAPLTGLWPSAPVLNG